MEVNMFSSNNLKLSFSLFLCIWSFGIIAQTPGVIVRPAGGPGSAILNPNGDAFSSETSAGFTTSDRTQSEIKYKPIYPTFPEPTSDLVRGPSERFTDIVRTGDENGFYMFCDGANLLFRIRVGGIVSGSKGYSVLLDTDGKFGNTGPYADPNFVPRTTGISGNPGFEREVVLETNFRVAVYNVDGTSNPTPPLVSSYDLTTNSLISLALSRTTNDPDYFYDFYVPLTALGIEASTPIRLLAATVMSPQGAIGGPVSDVYGYDNFKDVDAVWTTIINNQPPFTPNNFTIAGSGMGTVCTAAPSLNSPINIGTSVTISGAWTRLSDDKPSTATINLYRIRAAVTSLVGTTPVSSGNTWSIENMNVQSGDVFYAKSVASGENECNESSRVSVVSCTAANTSANGTVTCHTIRGIEGTRPLGALVYVYRFTSAGVETLASGNTDDLILTLTNGTGTSAYVQNGTTWRFDNGAGKNAGGPCVTAAPDLGDGTYWIRFVETGKCISSGIYSCLGSNTTTAVPVLTQTNLFPGSNVLSGTNAGALHRVRLFINGEFIEGVNATAGGVFTFSPVLLSVSDVISVSSQNPATGGGSPPDYYCLGAATSRTVLSQCYTNPPIITTTVNGNLIAGASTTISGSSSEPVGTVIRVFKNSPVISLGTTTVQAGGIWSISGINLVSGDRVKVAQERSGCSLSDTIYANVLAATTVCPTITTTGITESTTTISGEFSPSGTYSGKVYLYLDEVRIDSTASFSSQSSWTKSSIPANTLYPGGVISAGFAEAGKAENLSGCSNSFTIPCISPTSPTVTNSLSQTIVKGTSASFNLTSTQTGIIYTLSNDGGAFMDYGTSKFGTGSSLILTTYVFNTTGVYPMRVKAINLFGYGCNEPSQLASVTVVDGPLPVKLADFSGYYDNEKVKLIWKTVFEQNVDRFEVERSTDGREYNRIGSVKAKGNSQSEMVYGLDDNDVLTGKVFYRLKMIDLDDSFTYSNIIVVSFKKSGIHLISIHPNPFSDFVTFKVNLSNSQVIRVNIKDMNGRQLQNELITGQAGLNNIRFHIKDKISSGTYLLHIQAGNNRLVEKIVKF